MRQPDCCMTRLQNTQQAQVVWTVVNQGKITIPECMGGVDLFLGTINLSIVHTGMTNVVITSAQVMEEIE